MEDFLLWVIVVQGFFVMYFEYDVWRMNRHRFQERAEWRQAKRKQQNKKESVANAELKSLEKNSTNSDSIKMG